MIIENKTIISEEKNVLFPSEKPDRATLQLKKLFPIIKRGYEVIYNIFILTPNVCKVDSLKKDIKFNRQFKRNIKLGMKVYIFYIYFENDELVCEKY